MPTWIVVGKMNEGMAILRGSEMHDTCVKNADLRFLIPIPSTMPHFPRSV